MKRVPRRKKDNLAYVRRIFDVLQVALLGLSATLHQCKSEVTAAITELREVMEKDPKQKPVLEPTVRRLGTTSAMLSAALLLLDGFGSLRDPKTGAVDLSVTIPPEEPS